MTRRSTRSDASIDARHLLASLSECRRVLIEMQCRAKVGGPLYQGCAMVVAAIDGLSTFLTGNPYYHHLTGHAQLASKPGPESERQDGS